MTAFGWTVLALVFLDELLAVAAYGVWGWSASPAWLLVWLVPLAAMTTWWLLASPRAPYGGTVVRPVAKVLVFGLGAALLSDAGHPGWALGLLVFSVVINALALLPGVRALVPEGS